MENGQTLMEKIELGHIPTQPEHFHVKCKRNARRIHHRSLSTNIWTQIFLNFMLIGLFIGFIYIFYIPTLHQSANEGYTQDETYLERMNQEWNDIRLKSILMIELTEQRLKSMEADIKDFEKKLDFRSREGFQILNKLAESIRNSVPIGFIYVQLPAQAEPSILWPWANWTQITGQYAGHFFRAEGGNSEPFGKSQLDAFQGHSHGFWVKKGHVARGNSSNTYGDQVKSALNVVRGPTSDGTNGNARIANETRPLNYAVRFWLRIQ